MHLLEKLLFLLCVVEILKGDLLIYDNKECQHAGITKTPTLFSDLKTIIEGNRNISTFLQELNQRIENQISLLTSEIKTLKEAFHKQSSDFVKHSAPHGNDDHVTVEAENDYSLFDKLWIVVQRRQDGSVDFYRNWTEYKHGFGNEVGEFFVGLDKIYDLTSSRDHELLIILEDFDGNIKYAHYDQFLIGNETERYLLKKLGKYSGSAGDHLRLHLNMFFSTPDRDNDVADEGNCAEWFKGAWWFYHCLTSNLNGPYRQSRFLNSSERGIGVTWGSFDEIQYSYQSAQMMLRSK